MNWFREKEIEEKLGKLDVAKESDKPSAYRPPGARDRGEDRYNISLA